MCMDGNGNILIVSGRYIRLSLSFLFSQSCDAGDDVMIR